MRTIPLSISIEDFVNPMYNNLNFKNTYYKWLESGKILPDLAQEEVIRNCILLQSALYKWQKKNKWFKNLLPKADIKPKGIYIYGQVGRGKSMIMDLFYDSLKITKKRRIHFHAFMQEIHSSLNILRKNNKQNTDPLPKIARELAKNISVLCFDEFCVTDIADAMILSRLFTYLFANNVTVIATSNVAPDDLYKDGLQRASFLPFIKILKKNTEILYLDGKQDYRLLHFNNLEKVYFSPDNKENRQIIENIFLKMTNNAAEKPVILDIKSRKFIINKAHGDIALIGFNDLCEMSRSAADYIELAKSFSTILLTDIPYFNADNRDAGKRFVILIDELYEHKVKLICSAADLPMKLCTNEKLKFEFERTASRLIEMQSPQYIALPHF